MAGVALLALVAASPRGVQGRFHAQVSAIDTVLTLDALEPVGALAAEPRGTGVALSWTAGRAGASHRVAAGVAEAGGGCGAAPFATRAVTGATSYTDPQPPGTPGARVCYRVETVDGPWSSVTGNPTVAVQVGFVAAAVAVANGGTAGRLDVGDRIVVSFNQPVDRASGPVATDTVCTTATLVVLAATRTAGTCAAGEASRLGRLEGGTVGATTRWTATYAWSDGDRVLTVTLTNRVGGPNSAVTGGAWSLRPSAASDGPRAATGGVPVCTAGAVPGPCLPEATGAF